jgi:TOBE domain
VRVAPRLETPIRFPARVEEVIFSGASVRYLVATEEGGLRLFANLPHDGVRAPLAGGERVEVGWEPDAAVVVAR